jgi:hypothetical protein
LPSFVALPLTPVRSLKLGCSGVMPPSTTPMMTFSPLTPWSQRPPGCEMPRNFGVVAVSRRRSSSLLTLSTPGIEPSFSTCALVSSAAKPLKT